MEQTWRWFGPGDRVSLSDARQAGAEGIVTALHDVPPGIAWSADRIRARQLEVEAAGLRWSVVESLDVTEEIKVRGQHYQRDVNTFLTSLRELARCGLKTVAYNLMPVFSWMRTHLHFPLATGGYTTRFDAVALAAFDLFLLKRPAAEADWTASQRHAAEGYLQSLSPAGREELLNTILQGLPGGSGAMTLEEARRRLSRYEGIGPAEMRGNAAAFLKEVCPVADELGIRLCLHPDDPPRPLLGLPRIASTAGDFDFLMDQYDGASNAITFCTGALGVRQDNDLIAMAQHFAPRIGFAHLRSIERDAAAAEPESFVEACHLEGDADLVEIIAILLREEWRRVSAGNSAPLPFRADHGQELLNDRERAAQAGYPAIGRLRGLAELRGVLRASERWLPRLNSDAPGKDTAR